MLTLQHVRYAHPDKDVLFDDLNFTINNHEKIALTGNNGAGKSTLLRIMAGLLPVSGGRVVAETAPYYVPQHFGQFDSLSIARALHVEGRLNALREILSGNVSEANFAELNDDWGIEERCAEALAHWGLTGLSLNTAMGGLSGGQKTRVLLAGIMIHRPRVVLLDEPGNHLDTAGRTMLYDYIRSAHEALVVVSHDRTLLNLLPEVWELGKGAITVYGGNYDFYAAQKERETAALQEDVQQTGKALRKVKDVARAAMERQQKLDARGKRKQEQAGVATIMMNTLRNSAEKSTARMKDVHAGKEQSLVQALHEARQALPDKDKIRMYFGEPALPGGKLLVTARAVNVSYDGKPLWPRPLSFTLNSGQRLSVQGSNGSGKTSLLKMVLGQLQPGTGRMTCATSAAIYVDQDYALIDGGLTVYAQAQQFNEDNLPEHEVKSRLTHFLFGADAWMKSCAVLSGGEKMRLLLCCLSLGGKAPDLLVLDEPTNNLDLQNVAILTEAVNNYKGAVLVVSHDPHFLVEIGATATLTLDAATRAV